MKKKLGMSLLTGVVVLAMLFAMAGPAMAAKDTLRVGWSVPARKWNPHLNTAVMLLGHLEPVYEGLVGEGPKGELLPRLATKWEQTKDSITFTLRDDVVFHDGTKFDANAVKANIADVQSGRYPPNAKKLIAISSVEVIDATHIRFHLNRPAPSLLYTLQRFAGLMVSPAALKSNSVDKVPVGTGPWKLDPKRTISGTKYVYTLNKEYWDPSVQGVAEIEINVLSVEQQFNGFASGELEVAGLHSAFVPRAKAAGYKILSPEGPHEALHIYDRTGKIVPELADPRIRRALSYAIDRKAFARVVLQGNSIPSTQRYLPGSQWHSEEIEDLSYNLKKAKELMAEAGVKGFTFDTYSQDAFFDMMNEPIAGMLKKIGVTMNIKSIPIGQLFVAASSGKYAASIMPLIERHPYDFYQAKLAPDAFMNPFKYEDKEIDALAKKAARMDEKSAAPLWTEMSRLAAERGYLIHIGSVHFAIMVSKRAKNVKGRSFSPYNIFFRGVTVE